MALGTYSELVAAVGNWVHRTDLSERIPEAIALVESSVNTGNLFREMETLATLTIPANTNVATLPTDYLSLKSIKYRGSNTTQNIVLELLPDDTLLNYNTQYRSPSSPRFYSIRGTEIVFGPEQNCSEDQYLDIVYYQKVPALSPSNQTNWLLAKAPNVYLYGSLYELMSFMMDEERTPLFKAKWDEAMAQLKKSRLNESFSGSPIRSRSSYVV